MVYIKNTESSMAGKTLMHKRVGYFLFCLTGVFCAFLWMAERDLAANGNILWTGNYLLKILSFSLMAGGGMGALLCFLVYGCAEGRWMPINKQGIQKSKSKDAKFLFTGSLLLILLFWLPTYLAYYPAICSYDTTIQLEQIVSGNYIDHHPIAHTLLIQGSMKLGDMLFGSVNGGIGIYAALQMIFLAGMFAYGIAVLYRHGVKRGWILTVLVFTMIYPFHWYMSVSMIKDTVFSGFFILQMISLCELLLHKSAGVTGKTPISFNLNQPGKENKIRPWILFLFGTVGMILFRNNGKYAMLVLLSVLFLCICFGKKERKFWMKLFSCALAGFVMGNLLLSLLFSVTKAEQGDKREMLSMPIQQMARCMIYHGGVGILPEDDNTMDEQDKLLINDFLLDRSYLEYRPDISDPVKRHTNTYVVRYRTGEFIDTYLNLFMKYPGDYLNAVLAVNAGFLSPGDETHAVINVNGRDSGLGYVQTRWVENELNPREIYKDSKWESLHQRLEKWANDNAYLKIPVLKYLFVPGTFLWLYLLLACSLAVYKKYSMLLPLSLVAGYYVTLFLGPTVQLRYLYPVMIVLPFLVLLMFTAEKDKA